MMKTIIKYLILLLSTAPALAQAQSKAAGSPRFILKGENSNDELPDSIFVEFFKENISMNYGFQRIRPEKSAGNFSFKLPAIHHLSRFKLITYHDGKSLVNHYYAEASDDILILCSVKNKQLSFRYTGKGAEKYQLRDELKSEEERLKASLSSFFNKKLKIREKSLYGTDCSNPAFQQALDTLKDQILASMQRNQHVLDQSRTALGSDLINFFDCEFGTRYLFLHNIQNILMYNAPSEQCRQEIVKFYLASKAPFEFKLQTSLLKYSYYYALNEGVERMNEFWYQKNRKSFPIQSRYEELKTVEPEALREKLIAEFFMHPLLKGYIGSFEKRDSCLKDALATIKSSTLKTPLYEQLVFSKGSKVYNFSFADTLGKQVSLSDMKGKVFMLDFYGEGCGGCAVFSKKFEKDIYPEFASNPDFKVLSVSVDKTKERWSRAMKSGLYTTPEHINLSTGAISTNHPIFKYYRQNALPFILLADREGRLIAALNGVSSKEISNMIREALKQKAESHFAE